MRIGDGRCGVRAYRGLDRRAARTVLYGKVKAANEKKRKTQCNGPQNQQYEHGGDDGEFHRRGAAALLPYGFEKLLHDQPSRIMAIRLIGVGKARATLRFPNRVW